VLFTAHYLMLRGFYALEQTRRVFWIQCVIAATNIAAAVLLTRGAPAAETAPRLVVSYACAYAVGALLSYVILSRTVGGLAGGTVLRFLVRLLPAVAISGAAAWGLRRLVGVLVDEALSVDGKVHAILDLTVAGLGFLAVYLLLARVLRITEVTDVMRMIGSRLRRKP
jgi:putative peptidoglycan lipid II flippase